MVGTNGKVIATSEVYKTKQAAKTGIASIGTNGADAELVDESPGRGRPTKAKPARRVGEAPGQGDQVSEGHQGDKSRDRAHLDESGEGHDADQAPGQESITSSLISPGP